MSWTIYKYNFKNIINKSLIINELLLNAYIQHDADEAFRVVDNGLGEIVVEFVEIVEINLQGNLFSMSNVCQLISINKHFVSRFIIHFSKLGEKRLELLWKIQWNIDEYKLVRTFKSEKMICNVNC